MYVKLRYTLVLITPEPMFQQLDWPGTVFGPKSRLVFDETAALPGPQLSVRTLFAEQLLVRAFLDDTSIIHDHYAVHVLNGAQTVRDDNRGFALHQFPKGILDQCLTFTVK